MTRWISGRIERPITSAILGLMLVTFLLLLAPPQAQAQVPDLSKLFGKVEETTPVVVFDFHNKSTYLTGMPGRTFADALSMELMRPQTSVGNQTFDVMKRSAVEDVLKKYGYTVPLDWAQMAQVADQLTCKYAISGDIDEVRIRKTKEGTLAEVTIHVLVISRYTQMPINGAHVVQTSSPKIGFSGSTDVLVNEALATAAYKATQKLLDNRLPIGTILMSPRQREIVIKGGSTIGFRAGMECTAIRRESVTGRVRIIDVSPNESSGIILEDSKGIAAGDKVVPIFEYTLNTPRAGIAAREKAANQMLSWVGAILFAGLIATENGNKAMNEFSAPTATAMADAYSMNYPYGANIVRWHAPSKRVIAYIIYRDTNPTAPVAVIDKAYTNYVDSATPLQTSTVDALMKTTTNTITLDPTQGIVTDFTQTTTYDTSLDTLPDPEQTFSKTNYDVTSHFVPLHPGETVGYRVRVLYMDFDKGDLSDTSLHHPEQYALYLGDISPTSQRITCTEPPTLLAPTSGQKPTSGQYQCSVVASALSYILQVSSDPNFKTGKDPLTGNDMTVSVQAYPNGSITDPSATVTAQYDYSTLTSNFAVQSSRYIFWRMGAKVDKDPKPTPFADTSQKNWVFSEVREFQLDSVPPPPIKGVANQGNSKTGLSGRQEPQRHPIMHR